jgi:hypothetical protein
MWNKFYIQYSINNYKKLLNNNKFSWLKLNKIKSSSIDENNYLSQMAYLHSYNYDKLELDYDKNIYNNEDEFLYKMSIIHSKK